MKKILFVLLTLLMLTSCAYDSQYEDVSNLYDDSQTVTQLLIDLKGEVKFPNIYAVDKGTTLYELIITAGGFTKNANTNNINLATVLNENQMITIPSITITETVDDNNNLVNINSASINQLCSLPGIGTAKAKNIIEHRNNYGLFTSIEDIKKVNGIGEELFSKIKNYICV